MNVPIRSLPFLVPEAAYPEHKYPRISLVSADAIVLVFPCSCGPTGQCSGYTAGRLASAVSRAADIWVGQSFSLSACLCRDFYPVFLCHAERQAVYPHSDPCWIPGYIRIRYNYPLSFLPLSFYRRLASVSSIVFHCYAVKNDAPPKGAPSSRLFSAGFKAAAARPRIFCASSHRLSPHSSFSA